MYIAPWAKLRIPRMFSRKANPSATNIYIDDNTSIFTIVADIIETVVVDIRVSLKNQFLP